MKKTLILALSVAGLLFATSNGLAEDKKTITGEGQCAKCSLKKADSCQNVIVVKEDGKEVTYWLAKNDVSNKFHKNVCTEKKKVKAEGTVKEVDGKKEFTATKLDVVKE